MSENRPQRLKNENLKTEASHLMKSGEVELGKPVKLPYIRKISTNANANNPSFSRKSLEGKETRVMRNSNKELQLLEQTHLNLLTLQEIELCNERSREKDKPEREGFPRILMPNPLFARERSIDSLDNPHRLRSEKSITKLDFSDSLRDYRLGPVLGRGTYSVVRVARNREGKKFAVKAYLRSALGSEDRRANLESEIQILQRVQHPCIPAYQETIESEEAVHIVTELCENRSVAEWVREGAGEAAAREVARQVGRTLEYLHGLEIVHRDLKMENILVGREGRLKLIDYGFSRQLPRETFMLYDFCGTPHYIAPEVIQREGYFGKPADIWSLGVILYRMAVGSFPFKGSTEKTLFLKVVKGDLRLPPELSPPLASLLGRMLSFDYRKRPTAEELGRDEWVVSDHQ